MKSHKSLTRVLNKHFIMHPSRLETLMGMILSAISSGKCQKQCLSQHVATVGEAKAALRKVERFFQRQDMSIDNYAKSIVELVIGSSSKMELIIDRTNWKFGQKSVNYLVLAVCLGKGICFPLFFVELDKDGNSSTKERIDLLELFINCFGADRIKSLAGDREFVGEKWVKYLCERNIPIFLRIKENTLVDWGEEKKHLRDFFSHLQVGQKRQLFKTVYGQDVLIEATRSTKGELVVILTNQTSLKMGQTLKKYKRRWNIETMFKSLKTPGFNWESTHIVTSKYLIKLLMIIGFASILVLLRGITEKIPIKKTLGCLAMSIFKTGFDLLRRGLALMLDHTRDLLEGLLSNAKSIFSNFCKKYEIS
jgi:hypothetical protein